MQKAHTIRRILCALALTLTAALCGAQTTGYVTGTSSLTSFSSSTGAVVNSFSAGGTGMVFAVANDDVTLYTPTDAGFNGGALNVVSGQSGETTNTLSLGQGAPKVILSSDGSTAYVNAAGFGGGKGQAVGQVIVVDTATLTVTGTISMRAGLTIEDIALSPDNTTLYVAISCFADQTSCQQTGGACPVLIGVCMFNASTLALNAKIEKVAGYLAVSHDNKSLYITLVNANGFYIVDTSTLAITSRTFPYKPYGPAIVNPVANFAVIFATLNASFSTTAYVLNSTNNKIVGELFLNAPGGALVGGATIGAPAPAAFAPDGKSLWMLLACDTTDAPNCSLPGESGRGLAGVSFPSGALIGASSVPPDVTGIGFPQ